jgi:hypothetical protein
MSDVARWSQEQLDEHMKKFHPGKDLEACHNAAKPPKRVTARAKKMNATESAWAAELTKRGIQWRWEAITLEIANDCRYTPDFACTFQDHAAYYKAVEVTFFEVKRQWKHKTRPHIEDDALVKLKVAAAQYSEFSFVLVWLRPDGSWGEEKVEA